MCKLKKVPEPTLYWDQSQERKNVRHRWLSNGILLRVGKKTEKDNDRFGQICIV
jgi:hypothetical protein